MSGASGAIYGVRLLELLQDVPEVETHLVMSTYARMNIEIETDLDPKYVEGLADVVHKYGDQAASIASGSFKSAGMIVAPCSMKTLSNIVHSDSGNLLVRAADVVLKERRRLVLMPRETPLHQGHCRHFYEASRLGAIVAPPIPAFYTKPKSIDDLVTHTVSRVLDLFDIDTGKVKRWQGIPNDRRDV